MGILVLAADKSRAFDVDSRTVALANGEEVLKQTLDHAAEADFPVSVVLGPQDQELAASLQESYPKIEFIRCPEAPLGTGYSLSFGIDHVRDLGWNFCLIAFGNMPWTQSGTYNAIAKRVKSDNIILPRYQERPGHPVGYGSMFFVELAQANGSEDGSSIWRHLNDRVEYLELVDRGILSKVESPEDLLREM